MTRSRVAAIHGASQKDQAPDRRRRIAGASLFALGLILGAVLNAVFFFTEIASSKRPLEMKDAMLAGALPAFAMLLLYLPVPSVLDRFDPEPWWCLAMAFAWGAVAATGIAGFANNMANHVAVGALGAEDGRLLTTVLVAPVTEEIMKGVAVWGFLYFLRHEFDGVVDGIIYATFAAFGFAAVENVSYYARAVLEGEDVFAATFVLRAVIAPWGHPLYTSMTGIGVGIARESSRRWVRLTAPTVGVFFAILLHAIWNFVPHWGSQAFTVSLIFWFGFIGIFSVIVIGLVIRKGATIRNYLKDEVAIGNLSDQDLSFLTSAFGRLRSYMLPNGRLWRELMRAAARLALCKWHAARAARGQHRTFSLERIAPLRAELQRLKHEINASEKRSAHPGA